MNKWIAEFELEDGDMMPEHMDLTYNRVRLDFHCKPLKECEAEDYISRQEVLKLLANSIGKSNTYIQTEVLKIPPVYPKIDKPSGKWIIDDKESYRIWHCHCSNCGKDPQDYIGGTEDWWLMRLPNYCPICGSRNVVEEQGENTDGSN